MVVRYSCILCGIGISSSPSSESEDWLREYRAVDPNLRWDTVLNPEGLLEIPVMGQPAVDGSHGFVLHDACWRLLQKAGGATAISNNRLVEVCQSLPIPLWFNGLTWGHDYGGRLKLDTEVWYPWKEIFEAHELEELERLGSLEDPFRGSDLKPVLNGRLSASNTSKDDASNFTAPLEARGRGDCFSRLPWELREMILIYLETKDALNLRQSSWSFQFLFSSLRFWRSRFEPDCEKGFVFEARAQAVANSIDALLGLYRSSTSNASSPPLLNRQRVWKLARKLLPLISPPVMTSTSDTLPDTGDLGWISLSSSVFLRNSVATSELSRAPMHSTTTTEMEVSPGPVIIGIAMVNTGIWDYITGIRMIGKVDEQEQFLGFAFNSGEILCSVAALHGFNVAMGPQGVRALQIVGPRRDACSWIGRTEGVPISESLVASKSVNRLRVTCDGYKITALSINCDQTDNTKNSEPKNLSLRRIAIWYPEVPPEDLVLNDSSFTGLRPVSTTYQPISWIKFGGQRGKNLPHVKGVMIKFGFFLSALQFVYDCDVPDTGNATSEKFGRCGPSEMEGATLFSIDGAAGERITSVSVGLAVYENPDHEYLRHGILQYITMSTNFDRTTCLGKKKFGLRVRNVDVADGTTITGFYGHFAWGDGLINLGVISEYLQHECIDDYRE
ncbi:hypothetical protein MY3296_002389 [Beauveria thailandica]